MAKDKTKDAAKKAKAPKLPKRIGGVKLPKEARRIGGAVLAKANTPAGRELIASGLAMAATIAAARSKTGRKAANDAVDGATHAAKAGAHDAQVMMDAIGSMASSVMNGLFAKKG